MTPKKTTARRRKTTRKKKAARRTRSARTRRAPLRSRLKAALGIAAGIVLGWLLVSWLRDAGDTVPPTAINTTARGETLVEIPTREELAGLGPEERARIERQVTRALADVAERVAEPAPAPATRIRHGRVRGADAEHPASGVAELFQVPGGRYVLRLDELKASNGADLHVYLVRDPDIPRRQYVDLGRLRGNRGSQNYPVPAGTDPLAYSHMMIFCEVFERAYALAELIQ